MKETITIVVIGAGNRGTVYSNYALERPDLCKVVAVAEPIDARREILAKAHGIPDSACYKDAVMITTLDREHVEPAVAFSNLGYDMLLEKPMAVNAEDCQKIVDAVVKNKIILGVGHVLRYTPFTQRIKSIVSSGMLGDVVNVQHLEPVGWYHAAHSYVRGNWRNTESSSFMLLAKSCHDIDWIMYVTGKKCKSLSSFGSLYHFKPENKPAGAASRCLDCSVEADCPYSAKKIYLDPAERGEIVWNARVLDPNPNAATIRTALEVGPYGRCVYECDNNVVDNQVVNFQFSDGTSASFTMVAFSEEVCVRKTRIFGTRGELVTDGHTIEVFEFNTRKKTVFNPELDPHPNSKLRGHDFADYYFMSSWVEAVRTGDQSKVLSGPEETLASHLIVFEAEKARVENRIVNLDW